MIDGGICGVYVVHAEVDFDHGLSFWDDDCDVDDGWWLKWR